MLLTRLHRSLTGSCAAQGVRLPSSWTTETQEKISKGTFVSAVFLFIYFLFFFYTSVRKKKNCFTDNRKTKMSCQLLVVDLTVYKFTNVSLLLCKQDTDLRKDLFFTSKPDKTLEDWLRGIFFHNCATKRTSFTNFQDPTLLYLITVKKKKKLIFFFLLQIIERKIEINWISFFFFFFKFVKHCRRLFNAASKIEYRLLNFLFTLLSFARFLLK